MKKSLIFISTIMLIAFLCGCSNVPVDSNNNMDIDSKIEEICSFFKNYTVQDNSDNFEEIYQRVISDIEEGTNCKFLEDTGSGLYGLSFQIDDTFTFTVFGTLGNDTKFNMVEFCIDNELYYSYDIV